MKMTIHEKTQAHMQKRIDYLLDALEDASTHICMNRYDSSEKALSVIQRAILRDFDFMKELQESLGATTHHDKNEGESDH